MATPKSDQTQTPNSEASAGTNAAPGSGVPVHMGLAHISEAPAPQLPSSPPVLLMVHPHRWASRHGEILLDTGVLAVVDGLEQCRIIDGEAHLAQAAASWGKRGWRVVPTDIEGPGTTYIHKPERTEAHLYRWQRSHPGSSHVSTDLVEYVRWLKMVARTFSLTPPAFVLEGLIADHERLEASYVAAKAEPKLKVVRGHLEVLRQALVEVRKRDAAPNGTPVTVTL